MGKYDSSKYRVVPLVDAIKFNQRNFDAFLNSVKTRKIPSLICPLDNSAYFYGTKEKQLNPTKKHLRMLLRYIAENKSVQEYINNKHRAELCGSDPIKKNAKAEEALQLIEKNYNHTALPRAWYIFEGATNPDIYIEGDDYIIICEGKWTEPHITTKTTHLNGENEQRNQMIRHIQGALNNNPKGKKVYAFYIVDNGCDYLKDLSLDAFKSQICMETIEPDNKEEIIDAFYGYTTWQEIKDYIPSVTFLTKEEIRAHFI